MLLPKWDGHNRVVKKLGEVTYRIENSSACAVSKETPPFFIILLIVLNKSILLVACALILDYRIAVKWSRTLRLKPNCVVAAEISAMRG